MHRRGVREKVKVLKNIIFICILTFIMSGVSTKAASTATITDNKDGTATITYANSENKRIAVEVKKNGSTNGYKYFVSGKNIEVCVPMTMGNGTYTVSVYKNTTGNRYTSLSQKSISLKLKDEKSVYLTSTQYIDWSTKNEAIKQATKLTKSCKSDYDKMKVIYKHIVENYSYDFDKLKKLSSTASYVPSVNDTYKSKKGICFDIASLNAAMLRSQGVETKLIMGYPTNPAMASGTYHAWNKAYNSANKTWVIMDSTTDMQLYKKVDYKAMSKNKKQYSDERYVY